MAEAEEQLAKPKVSAYYHLELFEAGPPKFWQNNKVCGANCLYMFLTAWGKQPSHEELVCSLPITGKGLSLLDLENAAKSYGTDAKTVFATPSALRELPLPAIAHIAGEGSQDHFVLLCRVNGEKFEYIDGTTGQRRIVDRSRFESKWSGYLLLTKSNPYNLTFLVLQGCLMGGVVTSIFAAGRTILRRRYQMATGEHYYPVRTTGTADG